MKTVSVLAAKRLGIAHCHAHNTLQQVCSQVTEEDISSLVVVDESASQRIGDRPHLALLQLFARHDADRVPDRPGFDRFKQGAAAFDQDTFELHGLLRVGRHRCQSSKAHGTGQSAQSYCKL